MAEIAKEITRVSIEDELKQSYLDYAMSVIVGRALPDVRDGLKPVHRRVLFAMRELGNDWNKAYKKSARVVGDVIGKYHPHGDTRCLRHLLFVWRSHFPCVICWLMVKVTLVPSMVMLLLPCVIPKSACLNLPMLYLPILKKKPSILFRIMMKQKCSPRFCQHAFPNLLVNGSSGIAVGMATNIPPHNLTEVIECLSSL